MPSERFDTKDDEDDVSVILNDQSVKIRKSQRINLRIEAQITNERDKIEESADIFQKFKQNS